MNEDEDDEDDEDDLPETKPEPTRPSPQPLPDVCPDDWPTAIQAAAILNVSRRALYAMRDRGEIRFGFDRNNTLRFHPEDLEPDGSKENKLANHLIETLTGTVERLLQLTVTPYEKHSHVMATALESAHERIGALESKLLEVFEVYQSALTQEHERQLATALAERRQKRIDENIERAWGTVPAYVDRFFTSRGLGQLVDSLTEEQLHFLIEAGAITEGQATLIRRVKTEEIAKKGNGQRHGNESEGPDPIRSRPDGPPEGGNGAGN